MSKTKYDLALDLLATEGRTTVEEMRVSSGWPENDRDARTISRIFKKRELLDRLRRAKEQEKLSYSSVWFVARLRVRVPSNQHPNDAVKRMNECLSKALIKEYRDQFKGEGVLLIEDPAQVLYPQDNTHVPVIQGAAKFTF